MIGMAEKTPPIERTLAQCLEIVQKHQGKMNLQTFLEILAEKGPALLVFFLSVPFCLPIHIPGLSTPFGLIIAIIGLQITFRKSIWLPKFLLQKEISPSFLKKVVNKSLKILDKLQRWIHPRWFWMSSSRWMQACNGLYIVNLALFLSLPLPIPLTNLGVAWPLLAMSIGILERDGLFIFLGYFTGISYYLFLVILYLLIW